LATGFTKFFAAKHNGAATNNARINRQRTLGEGGISSIIDAGSRSPAAKCGLE
jgi:hypothetical protein